MESITLSNVDKDVMQFLIENANKHNTSIEVETLNQLKKSIQQNSQKTESRIILNNLRNKNAHLQTSNSVELIREDRDR